MERSDSRTPLMASQLVVVLHAARPTQKTMSAHGSAFREMRYICSNLCILVTAGVTCLHAARPTQKNMSARGSAFRENWPLPVPPDGASDGQCQIVYRGDSEIMAERIARFFC